MREIEIMDAVNWSAYSNVYDMLLAYNPAYQDLLERFRKEIAKWTLTAGSKIVDVGAGTGNFSLELARNFPESTVYHLDLDPGMTRIAEQKKREYMLNNLEITTLPIEKVAFSGNSLEGIVCVHSLYTFQSPQQSLATLFEWLSPGGYAFFCDPGRLMVLSDWLGFILSYLYRTVGLLNTVRLLWRGREILKQNRIIRERQQDGTYWVHTHEDFCQAVSDAGFQIRHSCKCFRDCSDLVVAQKPGRISDD